MVLWQHGCQVDPSKHVQGLAAAQLPEIDLAATTPRKKNNNARGFLAKPKDGQCRARNIKGSASLHDISNDMPLHIQRTMKIQNLQKLHKSVAQTKLRFIK